MQLQLIEMLGGKCEGCDKVATEDNMVCFDFHHVDASTKEAAISHMLADSRPYEIIKKEAEKCILFSHGIPQGTLGNPGNSWEPRGTQGNPGEPRTSRMPGGRPTLTKY